MVKSWNFEMLYDFDGIQSAIFSGRLPVLAEELFHDLLDLTEGRFKTQETYNLDYKHDVPQSFSEPHGVSIVRLALGFYNAFGGLIIFGVEDKTLKIRGTSAPFQVEAFNRVLSDITDLQLEAGHQRYAIAIADAVYNIDVVLVVRRGLQRPAKIKNDFGKYKINSVFVRDRHEVVYATTKHLPMLYSANRTAPSNQSDLGADRVHRSLPPSPSTMKEFIDRDALMEHLWDWLVFGKKPRLYLYGPGGSGKSTLAYEFSTSVVQNGNSLLFEGGQKLDYVVYLSGKETELNVLYRSQQYFSSKQFSNVREQLIEILYHSGFKPRVETVGFNEEKLLEQISELFLGFNGLIVLDDIDALSRRNVDTGEEALFTELLSVNRRTRLLYTLRYPPGHALSSAVQVPGLKFEEEFDPFLNACAELFETPKPNHSEAQVIFEESGGLPLLIESIIGLRKYCGDYGLAIESFKEKGGEEARRYLYQREYERLDPKGKGRPVLAALSLLPQGLNVGEIMAATSGSAQQTADALSECGSIFLSTSNEADSGTIYQISPPALPFISDISKRLPFFKLLEQTVKRLSDEHFRVSPREQNVLQEIERLRLAGNYFDASQLGEAVTHENSDASASPRIHALTGMAYAELGSQFTEKAREHFQFASQMRYRNVNMYRSWFFIEIRSEYGLDNAEKICQDVLSDSRFDEMTRSEFLSKLGLCFFNRAMRISGIRQDHAFNWLRKSIDSYMEALWVGEKVDRRNAGTTLNWLERPLNRLETASRNDFGQCLLLIEMLADRKHDVHMEGARAIGELVKRWGPAASTDSRHRAIGKASKTLLKIRRNFPELEQNVGFKRLFSSIASAKEQLELLNQSF